ncbi:hypothetical protein BCR36DRAFT_586748 [Piromyces finnis]|uniref:Uncharacterized protein n=1 Tax=Piromyces finnis TaxID=1754191 RepID=A0A1Y1UY11_9FUNG|nr:hypothetical protein BCR36DRAFT_586748 [Piromyces finnis]|eukprot:ORX43266.1 hypothetical protein BCR36DRAFT_586748 [Piromyces finnis]
MMIKNNLTDERNHSLEKRKQSEKECTTGFQQVTVYQPKINQLFKTIFGKIEHKEITLKFLKDLAHLDMEEYETLRFTSNKHLANAYKKKLENPIIDFVIEISGKYPEKSLQETNQGPSTFGTLDKEEAERKSEEKEEEEEEEEEYSSDYSYVDYTSKKLIVEMQFIKNNPNFFKSNYV